MENMYFDLIKSAWVKYPMPGLVGNKDVDSQILQTG